MEDPAKRTWKRIWTQGILAPLGMPYVHARTFFRHNFGENGSVSDRLQGNAFVSSVMSLGAMAGGGLAYAKVGGLLGLGAGFAALVPAYAATGLGVLGVIAAGSTLTGGVHGLCKVVRNVFERENLIYGREPEVPVSKLVNAAPESVPVPVENTETDFNAAARKQERIAQERIKRLDEIAAKNPRRGMGPDPNGF